MKDQEEQQKPERMIPTVSVYSIEIREEQLHSERMVPNEVQKSWAELTPASEASDGMAEA